MVQWMCERNQSESACFAQVSSSKPSCGINGPWRICSRLLCSKCCFVGTQRHTGKRYFWCHFFRPKVFQMQYTQLECPDQTQLWDLPGISYTPSGHIIPQEFTADLQQWCFVVGGHQQSSSGGASVKVFATQSLRGFPRGNTVACVWWKWAVEANSSVLGKFTNVESDFKFNGNNAMLQCPYTLKWNGEIIFAQLHFQGYPLYINPLVPKYQAKRLNGINSSKQSDRA